MSRELDLKKSAIKRDHKKRLDKSFSNTMNLAFVGGLIAVSGFGYNLFKDYSNPHRENPTVQSYFSAQGTLNSLENAEQDYVRMSNSPVSSFTYRTDELTELYEKAFPSKETRLKAINDAKALIREDLETLSKTPEVREYEDYADDSFGNYVSFLGIGIVPLAILRRYKSKRKLNKERDSLISSLDLQIED